MKLYHNPRCRKSRETLAFLEEQGIEPEIILYLKNSPDLKTIKDVVKKLGISPLELIRTKEQIFRENFKGKEMSDDDYLQAMVDFPKLIERPILINGDKAVIGRPKENILQII